MKSASIWLWNERHNVMGIADLSAVLPFLTVIGDDYDNSFYAYPIDLLELIGWIVIGEL